MLFAGTLNQIRWHFELQSMLQWAAVPDLINMNFAFFLPLFLSFNPNFYSLTLNRRSSIGGLAYGIPWNEKNFRWSKRVVATRPSKSPLFVFTTILLFVSSSGAEAVAVAVVVSADGALLATPKIFADSKMSKHLHNNNIVSHSQTVQRNLKQLTGRTIHFISKSTTKKNRATRTFISSSPSISHTFWMKSNEMKNVICAITQTYYIEYMIFCTYTHTRCACQIWKGSTEHIHTTITTK